MAYALCQRGTGTHQVILRQVRRGSTVLDVGAASGFLMRRLVDDLGCTVRGIEYDPESAAEAQASGLNVSVGDAAVLVPQEPEAAYDHIVFGDVLEHMPAPLEVLAAARALVKPGGSVFVSLPNVAFLPVRLGLLAGRWTYVDQGVLDRTHLRFFTRRTAAELVQQAGFRVRARAYTGPATYRFDALGERITGLLPGLLAANVILTATPAGS